MLIKKVQETIPNMSKVIDINGTPNDKDVYNSDAFNNSDTGYIKYPDGTMICYGNVSGESANLTDYYSFANRTDAVSVTFPQEFISTPVVTVSLTEYAGQISAILSSITKNSFAITVLKPKNVDGGAYYTNYIAIGKWK